MAWPFRYNADTDSRYQSDTWSLTMASFPPIFGLMIILITIGREGLYVDLGHKLSDLKSDISLDFLSEKHLSLEKTTDYNLFGNEYVQRENPEISAGIMRSIIFTVQYGDEYIPLGVIGQARAFLAIETSQPSLILSDYSFTMYTLSVDWRINTFLTRRLLPNALDIHLIAGTIQGKFPLQRFGIVDGSFRSGLPFCFI